MIKIAGHKKLSNYIINEYINKMRKYILLLFLTSISFADESKSRGIVDDYTKLKEKIYTSTRTDTPPVIDGNLDDKAWGNAVLLDDFLQFEPYNLIAPTVRTEVRILYDDDNIYVAFNNFDPNPEKIMVRRARRDDWRAGFDFNSDWVGIGIDSRNDDKTGFWFAVNAAEVQVDVAISGDGYGGFDGTWNAVWDSKVSFHDKGWSAEIRIPFNVFPYSKDSVQEWGTSIQRGYFSNQEEMHWPGRPKGVRGIVPHYGVLKGIENIPQPRNIELVPYLLGGQTKTDQNENVQNLGMDVRYNLNSNTTLNMTFNPDFGQVEADPSVLNLSAFETRLNERRPFFVQGANFFKSRLNLFNSRRIGKRPGYYKPESGSIIDKPNETTILGAAKILGETSSGLKYGVINAITDREYGTLEDEVNGETQRKKFLIEPYTNYFVGRLEKPVVNELSTIGFMATDLRRQNESGNSSVINADWNLKLIENKLSFTGQFANSIRSDQSGHAGRFILGYRDPVWWDVNWWSGYKNKNFDVSDMGYQEKNNNWYSGLRGAIRRDYPKGYFLNQRLELKLNLGGRGKDDRGGALLTRKNIELEQDNDFLNYWGLGWSISAAGEVFEDDDIYRDSRAVIIKDEAWKSFQLWFRTDRRKRVVLRPSFNYDEGSLRGPGRRYGLEITLRPTDFINFSLQTSKEHKPGSMQWVGIVEDENGPNIIYSNVLRKQTNTELRLNIAFSSKMTFEAYYQPFKVEMDYEDYNRLVREKSFDLEPYNYGKDKDFKIDNRVGTFVFRWEYLPGSLIYAVYNLNDNNYYSYQDGIWNPSQSNSLFIKIDRFFQL